MAKQRISYVDPTTLTDPAMLEELDRCRREGTPRPESSAIRAHVPACSLLFGRVVAAMRPRGQRVAGGRALAAAAQAGVEQVAQAVAEQVGA